MLPYIFYYFLPNIKFKNSTENINQWLSPKIRSNENPENLSRQIIEQYIDLKGLNSWQSKFMYLELIKSLKFYGSKRFKAKYLGYWNFEEDAYLLVSWRGIQLVLENSNNIIINFIFDNILGVKIESNQVHLEYNLHVGIITEVSINDQLKFECENTEEFECLIKDYANLSDVNIYIQIYT